MIDIGRAGILPKGEWKSTTQYERLDLVYYQDASYLAIKNTKGNVPSKTSTFWQWMCSVPPGENYVYKTTIATLSQLGIIKPDGSTIAVDGNGTISAKTATTTNIGVNKPDNNTLGITEDGVVHITAEYTRSILNAIGTKIDELRLDEPTLKLQVLSNGVVISEVSLAEFKGESYILTDQDKTDIAERMVQMIGLADPNGF